MKIIFNANLSCEAEICKINTLKKQSFIWSEHHFSRKQLSLQFMQASSTDFLVLARCVLSVYLYSQAVE